MGASQTARPGAGTRQADALNFIFDSLTAGHHPTMGDIASHLKLSKTRVRQLVDGLTERGAIARPRGAQRAITIAPTLAAALAIERLSQSGWIVDPDARLLSFPGCPKAQLPILPALEHIPVSVGVESSTGEKRRDGRRRRARAAADRAPGAGTAAA